MIDLKPPTAPKHDTVIDLHGDRRVDEYFWLRNKDTPEVLAYLDAESDYAEAYLKRLEPLWNRVYEETLSRIKQTDLTVPYRKGGHYYYGRTEEGKQYPTYCRKKGSLEADEEIVLDLNQLAEGKPFLGLGVYTVSPDANLLAYSLDFTGFREFTLYVKDLRTGELLPDTIEKVKSVAWAADNRTLFYTVDDHAKRSYRAYRHELGRTGPDTLVYEEADERFRVFVHLSRSERFLYVGSASHTTSEIRFLPAAEPDGELRLIAARRQDHEYAVEDRGDLFYIQTNDAGRNFRIVTAPVRSPGPEHWSELVPHDPEVALESMDVFEHHMVVTERRGGLPRIRIVDLRKGASHQVTFPEPTYSVQLAANPEFQTTKVRYTYESFVTPQTVYEYDMDSREASVLKETEVLGGYDRTRYESHHIWFTARDGTRVPISLVHTRGVPKDGTAPLLLYGYGSYGISMAAWFSHALPSLLDRGVVYAVAHIRGGGELGRPWHDAAKMERKPNTFHDFIDAAEHLIAEGYTSADRLAIMGGSAGGLLMGAVTNARPDLFKVVVSLVPFVDVLGSMSDETLPLTVGEYEEWGNPKVKEHYDVIRTYCPYTNIRKQPYPTMLIRTSYNDSQVMYWEPAKYTARLREHTTSQNPIVFHINMKGGHGGSSGRYDVLKERALDYAFVLWHLGIRG